MEPLYTSLEGLIDDPIFSNIFGNPDRVFLFSYFTLEFIVQRSLFGFTRVVKFHILFIFAVQMLQSWLFTLWDLICNPIPTPSPDSWDIDDIDLIHESDINSLLAGNVFLLIALISVVAYLYSYIQGLRNRYTEFGPALNWFTESLTWMIRVKKKKK